MKNNYFNHFALIIFLQFVLIIDISFGELPKNKTILKNVTQKRCKALLKEFKQESSLLLICSLENAVPVTFCRNCYGNYSNVLHSYNFLITQNDTVYYDLRCKDVYLNRDRLNIVQIWYSNVIGLWNEANCDHCFNNNKTLNNQTVEFFDKNATLNNCINNHTTDVCSACDLDYTNLNKLFNNIKEKDTKVCFDVEDQMNRTRSYWSKTKKCCQRSVNLMGFGFVSSVFACLPIVFYFGTYFYTKRQEANEATVLSDNPGLAESNSRRTISFNTNNFNTINNTFESAQSEESGIIITKETNSDCKSDDLVETKNNSKIIDDDDDPSIFESHLANISPIVIASSSRVNNLNDDQLNIKNSFEDNNFMMEKNVSTSKDITIPAEIHK